MTEPIFNNYSTNNSLRLLTPAVICRDALVNLILVTSPLAKRKKIRYNNLIEAPEAPPPSNRQGCWRFCAGTRTGPEQNLIPGCCAGVARLLWEHRRNRAKTSYPGVAQLVARLLWEHRRNRAKTSYPGVAQLVARLLWEQEVARSSRVTRTIGTENCLF